MAFGIRRCVPQEKNSLSYIINPYRSSSFGQDAWKLASLFCLFFFFYYYLLIFYYGPRIPLGPCVSYYQLALLFWIEVLRQLSSPTPHPPSTFFAVSQRELKDQHLKILMFRHQTGLFLAASVISCILGGIVAACVGIALTSWRSVGECAHGEG